MIYRWLGASWQTKLPAVIAAAFLIISQGQTLLDSDPKTVPDMTMVAAQIAIIVSLFQARANAVTSEQVRTAARGYRRP